MSGFIADITMSFYCKVLDSTAPDDKQPLAYSRFSMNQCEPEKVVGLLTDPEKIEKYLFSYQKAIANAFKVPVEDVCMISKEEYEENTKDAPVVSAARVTEDGDIEFMDDIDFMDEWDEHEVRAILPDDPDDIDPNEVPAE